MEETTLAFGVVILPTEDIKTIATDLVAQIEKRTKLISRLDHAHIPHITLFQGSFPKGSEARIEQVVNEATQKSRPIEIVMENSLYLHPIGNLFWNVRRTQNLEAIHLRLLPLLRPLTEGTLMPQWQQRLNNPQADLTDEQKQLLLKNGFAESGPLFLPHITLGKLERKKDFSQRADVQPPVISFSATTLVGGYLGEQGNLERILFSCPFSTS